MESKFTVVEKKDLEGKVDSPISEEENSNELVSIEQPKETGIVVEELGKIAQKRFINEANKGEKSLTELAEDMAETGATVKAVQDNSEKLSKTKGKEMLNSYNAKVAKSKSEKTLAINKENEAFYQRFRPILEFDFTHITGKSSTTKKEKTTDSNSAEGDEIVTSKAYSKPIMIITIILAVIPWLCFALILYVAKGINAIVELIRQFTKIAQGLIIAGVSCMAIYILLVIIDSLLKGYIGHGFLP